MTTLSGYKISNVNKKKLTYNKRFNFEKISISLKKGKSKTLLDIINFPNGLKNHTCKFYFDKFLIELSPFEKIHFYNSIKKKKFKNNYIYIPEINTFEVNNKYKSGFRFMYYDFIKNIHSKKKITLATKLSDLCEIYKICENFE